MSKKQILEKQLIQLLQGTSPKAMSGKDIAENLNVTTRTVRNYVKDLNEKGYSINSSKNGYKYLSGIIESNFSLNETDTEILIQLLQNSRTEFKKVDLQNQLFISEATLNRKLNKLSSFLLTLKLKIIDNCGFLYIKGDERNKRHLIYVLLDRESNKDILQELKLSPYQLKEARNALKDAINKYDLDFDNGTFNNIFMHIAVTIYRLQNYHKINSAFNLKTHNKLINSQAFVVASYIANLIHQRLNIAFNDIELDNLALSLLDTIKTNSTSDTKLNDLLDHRYILLSTLVINMIDKNYNLQLSTNNQFISRFALHIQNLNNRLIYKTQFEDEKMINKNIKIQFPFIYEIAVYASSQLSDILEHSLSENEINLIALHLGTLFMSEKEYQKQYFTLVDNNYLNSNENLKNKFKLNFKDQATIEHTYQSFNQLPDTTNPFRVLSTELPLLNTNMVSITPFLTEQDVQKIKERIKLLNKKEKSDLLTRYFKKFLPKSLLFREQYCKSSTGYIHFLCTEMKNKNFVTSSFENEVLKRENLSSTDFVNNIAIPHTLKPISNHTCIAMIINKKPTIWKRNKVQIIMLLNIGKNDHTEFQTILDSIISTFSSPQNIKQIVASHDYESTIKVFQNDI